MDLNSPNWFISTVKYFQKLNETKPEKFGDWYTTHRKLGFTLGVCKKTEYYFNFSEDKIFNEKEKLKLCYIFALHQVFIEKNDSNLNFTESISLFFSSQFNISIPNDKKLEDFITQRISKQEDKKLKNWEKVLPHSLLYCDIFAWQRFLTHNFNPNFLFNYQAFVLNKLSVFIEAVKPVTKQEKRYLQNFTESADNLKMADLSTFKSNDLTKQEKAYIVELIILTAWIDSHFTDEELSTIQQFQSEFKIESAELNESINFIEDFLKTSDSENLFILSESKFSIVQKKLIETTKHQILKNKKRIVQEISESKELVMLLAKSTKQKLSKEEQKKVKTQLIDIFKIIPSVAIFLLPAGSLLFPFIVKILPKKMLLPSAFIDENNSEP